MGPHSVDLVGHLWTVWNGTQGPLLRTGLLNFPDGLDLMPVVGGWADIALGAALAPVFGLVRGYNLVIALYLGVAGAGGYALARALGARPGAAVVAGLLLQLDGFVLTHLAGGRTEQVGLGFVALAVALAIRAWREPGWAGAVGCGLAGAAVVFVSWELAVLLAAGVALLAPGLWAAGRPAGCWRRWAAAAATAAMVAGPWAALFLSRTGDVRAADEGAFSLDLAMRASLGLLDQTRPDVARPTWAALAALLAAPWALRRADRRIGVAAAVALGLALVCALGPVPRLHVGPELPDAAPWGPFMWLRGLPLLGWYHWPDRLVCAWSVAGAAAGGLLVERLWRRRWLAAAVGVALVAGALGETVAYGRWPRGQLEIARPDAVVSLGALPGPGAVLDLPPRGRGLRQIRYQLLQMAHERPILFHAVLPHLTAAGLTERAKADPLLAWFWDLADPGPPREARFGLQDWSGLSRQGFRFAALHEGALPAARQAAALDVLRTTLGEPILVERGLWRCWEIPPQTPGEKELY